MRISGVFLTNLLRESWKEGRICNLKSVVRDISDDLTMKDILPVLLGQKDIIINEEGGETVDSNLEDWEKDQLSYKYVIRKLQRRYKENFEYVCDVLKSDDFSDLRHEESINDFFYSLTKEYQELVEVINDIEAFANLTSENVPIRSYADLMKDIYPEEYERLVVSQFIASTNSFLNQDLEFSFRVNISRYTPQQLQIYQMTGSNQYNVFPEHREAQFAASKRRGTNIVPEDIMGSVWNSGWLAPNGDFYGCPDLDHVQFSEQLYHLLGFPYSEYDYDYEFETRGWIKFSCGRWLFVDLEPTKQQYDIIVEWTKDRNCTPNVCFGGNGDFINLDILESKAKYAKEYKEADNL